MEYVNIIGAGYTGLIAAAMLSRDTHVHVYDRTPSLPSNHHAVMRFRTDAVERATGVACEAQSVGKVLVPFSNPLADIMSYAHKVTGQYRTDRSIADMSATPRFENRFIPPVDLAGRLCSVIESRSASFNFGFTVDPSTLGGSQPAISTLPMPALMHLLGYDPPTPFDTKGAIHITMPIPDCYTFASFYDPAPGSPITRLSITRDLCQIEICGFDTKYAATKGVEEVIRHAVMLTGIDSIGDVAAADIGYHINPHAKITPCDEIERRKFISWATDEHGVYSLGRLATWRPKVLLDDIPQDVEWIRRMIQHGEKPDSAI